MSGRYRPVENSLLTKHVVAAGKFVRDAGSTPAASTILNFGWKRRSCSIERRGALAASDNGQILMRGVTLAYDLQTSNTRT